MATNFLISDYSKVNTIKRSLALPDQRPEVEEGDELVVAFPKKFVEENFTKNLRKSWKAPDRRHVGGEVNFIPYNFVDDYFVLQEMIWDYGVTSAKIQRVDRRKDLAKLVIFVCLKSKGGSDFLVAPRPGKRILPDVFTCLLLVL